MIKHGLFPDQQAALAASLDYAPPHSRVAQLFAGSVQLGGKALRSIGLARATLCLKGKAACNLPRFVYLIIRGSLALMFSLGAAARVQAQSVVAPVVPSVEEISFLPQPGSLAHISVDADLVTVTLKSGATISEEKITMETENKISVQIADYNFDGHPDFSLSHTDDGKGTYRIYEIYVFSPAAKKFVPLQPRCGDDFINVVLSESKQRRLTNSYVSAGTWKTCTKKY